MSIVELVRIPVAPDDGDALVAAVRSGAGGYLAAPRCEGFEVLRARDGDEVVVIVTWASEQAHDEAAAAPEGRRFLDAVGPLAAGPPALRFFDRCRT